MDIAPDQNTRQSERIRPFDRPPSLLSVTLFHVDAGDTKHGGLNSEHSEHTHLDMATTFQFHTLLLKSSIFSSSTYMKKCLVK